MFEKVVESILVEYVSEWVEGLDAEKMKIALFGGKVEVRELKLKAAALDKFQLPLRVKAGTLGRLALKVPWKRLTKEAVKLVIEDIFLLVVPAHQDEMQQLRQHGKMLDGAEDSYELRMRFAKQQEIRVRELLEKSKTEDGRRVSEAAEDGSASVAPASPSAVGADPTSAWGYREKMLHNILDNVSVEIKNIHVRYEDTTQLLSKNAFAVGVTIASIVTHTTNANGHVTFVDRAQSHTPFVHKTLEVLEVGLYCDNTSAQAQDLVGIRRQKPPPEAYIIRPFNISAKMTVNHDEATLASIPRLQFVADIGSIGASVTESQCNDVVSVVNFVSTHEIYLKRIHIRKKRPKIPVKRDARSWWMYALYGVQILYGLESKKGSHSGSHLMSKAKGPRCSWELFGQLWLQRKAYVSLHKKLLRGAAKKVTPETLVGERIQLSDLEDQLGVETIVFFRLCAEQEYEMEESRHDSVKKLSWKARWKVSSSSSEAKSGASASVLRRMDPRERLLLYTGIAQQMHASSTALAAKEQEKLHSKAILYALDLAVKSFAFSLVEPAHTADGSDSPTAVRTKEFLRFDLDQFVCATFQRTNACTISASIRSIQMLDFSHAVRSNAGTLEPQPLFYTLVQPKEEANERASTVQGSKFVELSIDSGESHFKLSCVFQPFRYIHHLVVASKLQAYFTIQVEVAPELKENAEEALAHSSVWLNNAVFSKPPAAAVRAVERHKHDARNKKDATTPTRVVQFSVVLPVVDVFVLSSEASPILEAKLSDIKFKSGNLLDTFDFTIEGVEVVFIDGLSQAVSKGEYAVSEAKLEVAQTPPSNVSTMRTNSYYELAGRKRSTILRKTRIVFSGEKKTPDPHRVPCWAMKCTAPPIYFTLSSAQYQQVVQASATWALSANKQELHPKLMRQTGTHDISDCGKSPLKPKAKSVTEVEEFDPNDERFTLCVHIPQILIVLEGVGDGVPAESPSVLSADDATAKVENEPEIDLVLDIRLINVEAKYSSAGQAIAADFRRLLFFKRKTTRLQARVDSHGKKIKLTTAEAISQVNDSLPGSRTSSLKEQPDEPDAAFHPETGEPSSKLIEIGQKVTVLVSSAVPLKGKVKMQQVMVYWDHDLLVALFRSYLWGNAVVAKSAPSSTSSSRTSSSDSTSSTRDPETIHVNGGETVSAMKPEPLPPFSMELAVDKWFVFMRPHGTLSKRFALKLYGKDLTCKSATLCGSSFSTAHVHASNGIFLESSRFVLSDNGDLTGGDDVCELLQVQTMKVKMESAGQGAVLAHRTGAASYVSAEVSRVELNYVDAHVQVLSDHVTKQILGFFNWVSIQLQPRDVTKTMAAPRTKMDVKADKIKVLVPRGPVGNAIARERKPERLELDMAQLVVSSRPCPKDPKVEQLLFRADGIQLASFLVDTTRDHTDAVASIDEAVERAAQVREKHAHEHAAALAKTTILSQESVFIDLVSLPIPRKPRKRKPSVAADDTSSDKPIKPKRPLDLEDVAKEMENYCSFVRVFLERPIDWAVVAETPSKKPRLNIQAVGRCMTLALEKQQIELLACLADENFGRPELLHPHGVRMKDGDDEKQVLDVQVSMGDLSLALLRPSNGARKKAADLEGVAERTIGRMDLESVHVSLQGFASSRGQQRVTASRARFYQVDAVEMTGADPAEGDRIVSRVEHRDVECGELYLASEDTGLQCLDVTIDQQGPTHTLPGSTVAMPPLEVRIYVDTCALLPSFFTLMTRVMPHLAVHPTFPGYIKKKGNPLSVSLTTGMVHCMLAEHPVVSADKKALPLHLAVSGCAVVRYSEDDGDSGSKHIQVFGRKMSLEIAARWPPLPEHSSLNAVAPSPCSTPTYASTPRDTRGSTSTAYAPPKRAAPQLDYRRVLCDDFAVDLDLVDTEDIDNITTITASLTHFHAVLCTFDLVLLINVQKLIDAIASEAVIASSMKRQRRNGSSRTPSSSSATETPAPVVGVQLVKKSIVSLMLEDASVTFVREIGEYFSPLARVYSFRMVCDVQSETPPKLTEAAASAPQTLEVRLHFPNDSDTDLRDDEGLSVWAFNAVLGSWEPILEPWTFTLTLRGQTDGTGKVSTKIGISGSDAHSLNANFSPRLLDTFCAIAKELEPLSHGNAQRNTIPPASASVISCGFYLANDTGVSITYWISDHTPLHTRGSGFTYAPRTKHTHEVLQAGHKVPLKLSTAIFPSLPNDQTLSFSWGQDEWHPLTDVRIHSAGKYVYSVLPKPVSRTNSRTVSSSSSHALPSPKVLLALFDISAVFGYRTLTVSSLVRVFNDADVPIECALLGDDGKTTTTFGVVEPQSACGVPITLIRSIVGLRLLIRPHRLELSTNSEVDQTTMQSAVWERDHRWSNELLLNDKDEAAETIAACSLVLDDFDCKCQRMFDGSQPLHVSQICRANGAFFRVWHRFFTASNSSNLKYAQLRVLPTLTFENKCGVAVFVVAFVFKKVRRTGVSQDREYSHIVASEKIAPHGSMQFLASSLQETTYCAVSITGFSWGKLFKLPSTIDTNGTMLSPTNDAKGGASGFSSIMASAAAGVSSSTPTPPSPSSRSPISANDEVLCSMEDFQGRKASINVTLHGTTSEQPMRRVVIQPRYLIRNETSLRLTFEPSFKHKSRLQGTKSFFAMPSSSSSKQAATCCGSPQLEMIHTKLNALHGATTTPAAPASTTRKNTARAGAGPQGSSTGTPLEETDPFYCSETNMISVQIEGNTLAASGVVQFRLEAAVGGTNSNIRLFDESTKQWHDVVVILQQIDAFTTKATFVDRYVLLNRTDFNLLVAPACDIPLGTSNSSQESTTGSALKPHLSTPYHWSHRATVPTDPSVRLKISDPSVTGWRWSGRVSLHDVSECAFKLSNKYTSQVHTVRVEVRVESSVRVFVVISSEDNALYPLYRVINSSAHEVIHFKQSFEGGSGELSEQTTANAPAGLDAYSRGVTQRLLPGESLCFGWDEGFFLQSLERVLEISYSTDAVHTKVLLDQPGEAQRIDLPATSTRPATSVYVHWYLNGVTKTVHIHDTQLPRDKLTGKLSTDAAQCAPVDRARGMTPVVSELALTLKMPNMMLSMLNSTPEEILLFTAEHFDFTYASSRGQHDEIEVKIGSFQLDNQLANAVFPVVFTPTPLTSPSAFDSPSSRPRSPRSRNSTHVDHEAIVDTFFHLSVFRLSYGDDVDYIKYLSAMVQPARLQVDDFLVISVALLSSDCLHVVHRHYPPTLRRKATSVNDTNQTAARETRNAISSEGATAAQDHETVVLQKLPPSERRMYIETLELHPFKIQVTFQQNNLSKAPLFHDDGGGAANFLLPVVFVVLKSNLVNVDAAAINLNALHIYHSFMTKSFMLSAIQQHYAFQGILQMYSLLGSADILGNPLGLVKNLGTGVKDFFYEPMAGMVKSPQEFVFGLSRGTASLVKNSVYGTFNAASKFTGTLSSGIAALSMDSDYIQARNTRNRQEVATHIGTGLYYGTKQLGQGILAGVSGVITAPALGAYNNGLSGFVEGIGKGLIGVAVKPTAGILDLAAKTTAGITATATVFDKKARDTRMRLPRMMHTGDKRLRVYSSDEAMISQLLHRLPHRLLGNEHYEAHVFVPVNRAIVATSHQFFHVDFNSSLAPGVVAAAAGAPSLHPRVTWRFPLSSVWGAQRSPKGVSIFIGSASHVSLASGSVSAPASPSSAPSFQQSPVVTKSSMTTVLVPMKESDAATMDRLVKCVSELVARQRERAPVNETLTSPLPKNSIGMVLEPVRDAHKVQGYEGYGGRVVDVFVGSVCYRAGVEVGDIIVGFGDQKMEAGDHGSALRTQLSMMRKGDSLALRVLRHGVVKHMSVVTE